jgi:hypothetical protein
VRDGNQAVLQSFSFKPDDGSENTLAIQPFLIPVPENHAIRSFAVLKDGQELALLSASSNPPAVTVISPNGGESFTGASIPVAWAGVDDDGDALSYALFYSQDGALTWTPVAVNLLAENYAIPRDFVPGSTQALIRVVASDGFWTVADQSDATFSTAFHGPVIEFVSGASDQMLRPGERRRFEVVAYDIEDGLLTGSNLVWISDRDGVVFTGSVYEAVADQLTLGLHDLRVVATDQDSQSATSNIPVQVGLFRQALITQAQRTSGTVRVAGQADRPWELVLEASSNLVQWISSAAKMNYDSSFVFTNPINTNNPAHFFRVSTRPQLPTFAQQTASSAGTEISRGDDTILSVLVSSAWLTTYQWYFNGQAISGKTESSLVLNNVQSAQAGAYWVFASNQWGSATSDALTLSVLACQSSTTNDNFADAMVITTLPFTYSGENKCATIEPGEVLPGNFGPKDRSLWFTWTAPFDGSMIFTSSDPLLETNLAVWTGDDPQNLTLVVEDDGSSLPDSYVSFDAVSGTVYRIAIYGYDNFDDVFTLHVEHWDP